MVKIPRRQQGMTLIGWVIVLAILFFFLLLGMRLFPMYYEAYAINRALQEVADDASISARNRGAIQESLYRRFNVNAISDVEAEQLEFEEIEGGVKLILDYEARAPFMGNLYLVGDFRKTATAEY